MNSIADSVFEQLLGLQTRLEYRWAWKKVASHTAMGLKLVFDRDNMFELSEPVRIAGAEIK